MTRDLFERHAVLRVLVYVVTTIAVMYAGAMIWGVAAHYWDIILLLFLAWLVAFTLQPLSKMLERLHVPRLLAVTLIFVALLALAVGSIVLAIPTLSVQISKLAHELTALLSANNINSLANQAIGLLQTLGLSQTEARGVVDQFSTQIPARTGNLAAQIISAAEGLLGGVSMLVFDALLVAILSFYIMLDGDRLFESAVKRLPPAWIPDVRLFQSHVDAIFGGFLRAALIVGAVYTAFNWVVLAALGHPDGVLFALLAGVFLMVPFVGSFLAIAPPILLIVLDSPPNDVVRNVIIVVVALIIAQQITMQIVAPRVMSAHVGLHPLVFFVALLVGLKEAGIWGAVFSGPVAGVIVAMLDTFFERWQIRSTLYPNVTGGDDEADQGEIVPPPASEQHEHEAGAEPAGWPRVHA